MSDSTTAIFEAIKTTFPAQFVYLGESEVARITDNADQWSEKKPPLRGGDATDYSAIADIVIAATKLGATILLVVSAFKRKKKRKPNTVEVKAELVTENLDLMDKIGEKLDDFISALLKIENTD